MMENDLKIITGIIMRLITVILLLKRYDTRSVLIRSGLLCAY